MVPKLLCQPLLLRSFLALSQTSDALRIPAGRQTLLSA